MQIARIAEPPIVDAHPLSRLGISSPHSSVQSGGADGEAADFGQAFPQARR